MRKARPADAGREDGATEGVIGKRHSTPPRTPRPGRVAFPSPAGLLTDGSQGSCAFPWLAPQWPSHDPRRLQLRGQFRFARVASRLRHSLSIPFGNRPPPNSRARRRGQDALPPDAKIPQTDTTSETYTISRCHGADLLGSENREAGATPALAPATVSGASLPSRHWPEGRGGGRDGESQETCRDTDVNPGGTPPWESRARRRAAPAGCTRSSSG